MNLSLFQKTQIAVATVLLLAATTALAADVELQSPPGGNVIFKDSAGTVRLQVQGSGAVTIPNLTTAPQLNRVTCFDSATGVLGQCLPGALPIGATGPMGATGLTGAAGVAGVAGTTGLTGATGAAGSNGATGAAGAAGAVGATGAIGATGPMGTTGSAGAAGAMGAIGATGGIGATGLTGATGAAGTLVATTPCAVGSFVTAFAAGAPVCAAMSTAQCPAGTFVTGLSAGQPVCSALPDIIFLQGFGTQIPAGNNALDMDTAVVIIESFYALNQGDVFSDGYAALYGPLVLAPGTGGAPTKAICQSIPSYPRQTLVPAIALRIYCVKTNQGRYGYVQFISNSSGGSIVNWTTWQ